MSKSRFAALSLIALGVLAGCTTCGGGGSALTPPPPPPAGRPEFDRSLAFSALTAQCDFGPREPGSQGHEDCRAWLVQQLTAVADSVVTQDFTSRTPMGGPYQFQNILGLFGTGQPGKPLLLGAHWDTRPVADQDPNPANQNTPILGANDGASGVAVLLELGRLMKQQVPSRPVIVAFFDAEDSGIGGTTSFPHQGFCIGSEYLASHWPASVARPGEMILLDIVGTDQLNNPRLQKDGSTGGPEFKLEGNSLRSNPTLVNAIWSAAEQRGHKAFKRVTGQTITDDHVPFINRGIPAVDIIHFVPAEWHTVDDAPAHCSADTLYQVGDTLVDVIW